MSVHTPLAELIQTRMGDLGLARQALGFRLGYQNPLKAGRVDALCDGHLTSRKSQRALARLPEALEIPPEIVEQVVSTTEAFFAEIERHAEEESRRAAEAEDAGWRRRFTPHAVVQTEHTGPSQITICGLTGGAERWLIIRFDLSRPPITFVQQALEALPNRVNLGQDGKRYVTFFGEALGVIVNYAPDNAIRCDLEGRALEVLERAYRPGEVGLSIGGRPVEPRVIARLLGTM